MNRVMIIDDDRALCRSLEIQLREAGCEVESMQDAESGLAALQGAPRDILLLDLRLPDRDGLSVLDAVRGSHPDLPVVMITGESEMKAAIEAMRRGAFDYLRKPFDFDEVLLVIEKAARRNSRETGSGGTEEIGDDSAADRRAIVGRSRAILEVIKEIGVLSRSRVTVLIEGESGTGKELVARALHEASCPERNFTALNCSAIVPTLLESELFGHEKGSFTGASGEKKGKLEHAGEGTLFLDEIGDMPLELQARVLRVLQEREFERVGGVRSIQFRARVVAATNRDLEEMTRRGEFRTDLYFRLAVTRLHIPPLRERAEDIRELALHILPRVARELHSPVIALEENAIAPLMNYDWPGNVRELENVLTRAVALCRGKFLGLEEIGRALGQTVLTDAAGESGVKSLQEVEREHILHVLGSTGWNITRSAGLLGISPTTLRKKIHDFGLKA